MVVLPAHALPFQRSSFISNPMIRLRMLVLSATALPTSLVPNRRLMELPCQGYTLRSQLYAQAPYGTSNFWGNLSHGDLTMALVVRDYGKEGLQHCFAHAKTVRVQHGA